MFLINFVIAVMIVLCIGFAWHLTIGKEIKKELNKKADTTQLNYMFNSVFLPQNKNILNKLDTLINYNNTNPNNK